ncbi:GTP-binding protein 10-like [Argiope bruennichi]|uniref:GTP-binding protein 10 like protein n=1 Tax=Argiope bruennichi TaxID=94029 RepID=A0A8T0EXW0_ARGBR|nr:GTP-binding protein 10-like [Argiope bruennichi]KAF8783193.1 GTP-binding protein 10 like protein [Argiope bruennichi]
MVRLTGAVLKAPRKFIDSVRITARGGRGGNGIPKYGGIGGKGGDVFLEATENYSLLKLKREFPTQRFIGGTGGNSKRFQILGSPGEVVSIKCPPGVTAVADNCVIGELNRVGEKLLLARGGCGGGPQNGFIGQKGQHVPLTLDLKLLADVGFVGYPNAGKSTLLQALSNAKPKIANYPFTTIAPNIGILSYDDFRKITAADLPGLIEGAHLNYGMGHKFLKHCLRTKILLFVVDINGFRLNPDTPHRTPFETVMLLNKELELYDEELVLKPALLAVNKIDMDEEEQNFQKLKEELKFCKSNVEQLPDEIRPTTVMNFDAVVSISAKEGINIPILKQKIRTLIDIHQDNKKIRYLENTSSEQRDMEVIYA